MGAGIVGALATRTVAPEKEKAEKGIQRMPVHIGCFFFRACLFGGDWRRKVSQLAPTSILASILLERA